MENLIQITSVPLIVTIVYALLTVYKKLIDGKEKSIKIIPVIAAVLGVILGIVAFYAVPDIIAADNFTAILIGGASGLAATGTNQIFKQLVKKDEQSDENKEA